MPIQLELTESTYHDLLTLVDRARSSTVKVNKDELFKLLADYGKLADLYRGRVRFPEGDYRNDEPVQTKS